MCNRIIAKNSEFNTELTNTILDKSPGTLNHFDEKLTSPSPPPIQCWFLSIIPWDNISTLFWGERGARKIKQCVLNAKGMVTEHYFFKCPMDFCLGLYLCAKKSGLSLRPKEGCIGLKCVCSSSYLHKCLWTVTACNKKALFGVLFEPQSVAVGIRSLGEIDCFFCCFLLWVFERPNTSFANSFQYNMVH